MENKRCTTCKKLIIEGEGEVACQSCGKGLHKDCSINDNGTYCDTCHILKTEAGEVTPPQIFTLPDVIRRSHIESYRTCPYMAFNEIIKEVSLPHSSFAQVGIDLHELFHLSNIGEMKSRDEMIHTFETLFRGYDDSLFEADLKLYNDRTVEEHRVHMRNIGLTSIDGYHNLKTEYTTPPFESEKNIIFSVGDNLPKVSITMDRVDEDGAGLFISDYKTGHVIVGQKIVTDLQPPLYIHAVRQEYGRSVNRFALLYVAENKRRVYEKVTEDLYECKVNNRVYQISINAALEETRSIFRKMQNGEWSIPHNDKSMYFKCKICQIKAAGMCNGAELESWKGHGELVW